MARVRRKIGSTTPSRLTLIAITGKYPNGAKKGLYSCTCGNTTETYIPNVDRGLIRSCGCLRREYMKESRTTHGMGKSGEHSEYNIWTGMRNRCTDPSSTQFHNYGGRGITVCDRWRDSFENFLEDMGKRPSKNHTLDRIDNDKGYSPDNCRWATHKEQSRNRRTNHFVVLGTKRATIAEWIEITGLAESTIYERLGRGWSEEEAVNTPPYGKKGIDKIDSSI